MWPVAKKNLLLVDADSKSLRMLEVSLRKSGFSVTTAVSAGDARDKVKHSQPDLIITDTKLPGDENGFELVANLKANADTSGIPIIFLSSENKLEQKVTGLELGVEDYLTKPIYIREVLTRVRVLLEKKEKEKLERRERSATFAGSLGEMGLVDLMQTVEIGRKTGRLHIETRNQKGTISFREGKVCDARTARLSGERAFYRMLVWNEGVFSMDFGPHDDPDVIELSTQGLLMEGMRRVDEWGRLLEQLPPLDRVFEIDYGELVDRLAEIPDEINGILRLFDGRRTLIEVVDESDFGDLEALEIASKLFFEGLIYDVTDRPPEETEPAPQQVQKIEAWLEGGEADEDLLGAGHEVDENARLEPTMPPMPADEPPPGVLQPRSPSTARPTPGAPTTPPQRAASQPPIGFAELSDFDVPTADVAIPPALPPSDDLPPAARSSGPMPSMPTTREGGALAFDEPSRVPGFRGATMAPSPRPLPAPMREEPQARSVIPRAAVGATAWSTAPVGNHGDEGWEDVVVPDDSGDDLGLSDRQGKRDEPAAAEGTAAGSAAEVTAPSTLSGDLPAAPTPQPLPPELASEAASAFDDDPISADRLLRTGHAGTPTPDHLPQRPRIMDTIPELKSSSSAGPTVVNPLQIGVTAAPLPASSLPPSRVVDAIHGDTRAAPPVATGTSGPPRSGAPTSVPPASASVPPTPASVPPTPASLPPTPGSVPPSLGTSQPPVDASGLSAAPEALSALPVTASAVESVALAGAGSSRAPGSEAPDDDSLLASFAAGEGDRRAGPRGDRIHTARTAVDLEPPPARNWTTVALGAAGFCAVMVVAMLLTEAWLDAGAAPDAGQGHAAVDAGAPRATDAGATLVVGGADAGRADAGTHVAAGLPAGLDAGSRPAVPDAGLAIATAPDAGTRVAATPDAGLAEDPEARYAGHLKSADAAARAGAFAKAVREYKAALALKPSSVAAQLGLGNAYYELDTLDAARTHLERARALAPKDPQVYLLLGAVYQSAGSRDDAIGAYQKYLELAPGGKFARDVQNILKGLQTP